MRKLTLENFLGFSDLSSVAELQMLQELTLLGGANVRTLKPVGQLENLRKLSVGSCRLLEEIGWGTRSPDNLEIFKLVACHNLENDAISLH